MVQQHKSPLTIINSLKATGFALLACSLLTLQTVSANDNWSMQSAFPKALPLLGEGSTRFAREVTKKSGGTLSITYLEPNSVANTLDLVDAVAAGTIEMGYTTSGYETGRLPSMSFFAAVPFGASEVDQYAWVGSGEGQQLLQARFSQLGVHAIPCGYIGPEGGGWFRSRLRGVQDLRGLKMRFFGLGGRVMQKLGVSTQLLAGSDIIPALQRGTIDATEFSTPYIDYNLGLQRVIKNYYYPSWHQDSSLATLVINLASWQSLDESNRQVIKDVCHDNVMYSISRDKLLTNRGLSQLKRAGAVVRKFPTSIIANARKQWKVVAKEEAANDSDFATVYAAYNRFLQTGPADSDGDTVIDVLDNCPFTRNKLQKNSNKTRPGDVCDDDDDGDTVADTSDNCPSISNRGQSDSDGDGIGDACDAINLSIGNTNTDEYGWQFGTKRKRARVVMAFQSTGSDLLLSLQGYDIDSNNEVTVWVNKKRIGALKRTKNNGKSTNRIVIAQNDQQPGENLLEFRARRSGERYGVTRVRLQPLSGPQVALTAGVADTNKYGYRYPGSASYPGKLTATFSQIDSDVKLTVRAFDIDSSDEVSVFLNGQSLGALRISKNNGERNSVFTITRIAQQSTNTLEFVQKTPGDKWGLRNLRVRPDQ